MPFLTTLTSLFQRTPPKPPTVSQKGIQARAIRHLICKGSITAREILMMGTNDASKLISRLRTLGLLFEADDHYGLRWQDNANGSGRHKVHYWTRKVPQSWNKAPNAERRKGPRKGRA